MRIVFLHGQMFQAQTWSRACGLLAGDGIELTFFSPFAAGQEAIDLLASGTVDICIAHLYHDLPLHDQLLAAARKTAHRIGLGQEIPPGFTTFSPAQATRFEHYLARISADNYCNGIRFLAAAIDRALACDPPEPVRTVGVYHPDHPHLFATAADYLRWRDGRGTASPDRPLVGLLCFYGHIAEGNHAEIDAVVRALERHDLTPLCVVTEGMADSGLPPEQRAPWLPFFREAAPEAVLNLLAGRLLARPEDVIFLTALDVPVFQLIRLYHQTPEQWRQDTTGCGAGAQSMVYSLTQPEMAGVIEPTVVAATAAETDPRTGLSFRRSLPLEDRIDHLCRRVRRWIGLRRLDNRDKRLTVVLHNNPCKGVEATLGMAVGLDTFASLAALIAALREAGYDTGEAPEDGAALLALLLERKAISEFRWTTADEIVAKGGVLHHTDAGEYHRLLAGMPASARARVEADWGPFPGEGMVYRRNGEATLLVTGLRFGKLQIMVQPKRGCYGAKCTGEVCRILHDPHLSPPPHWLATYGYIRDTSDAVLHFGAHGSLEFLPGKQVGLSDACFPEISLGDLPNISLYVMDVPGEGLVAKRRGRAVIVDHLVPVQRPVRPDESTVELAALLAQYQKAGLHGEAGRQQVLRARMEPAMRRMGFLDGPAAAAGEAAFAEAVAQLSRRIARMQRMLSPTGLHLLGTAPDTEGIAAMLATILAKPVADLPTLAEIAAWNGRPGGTVFDNATVLLAALLQTALPPPAGIDRQRFRRLEQWCRDTGGRIGECTREIPQLLKALAGGYIEPGLSGSLALGAIEALPTGRNFFTSDVRAMPTLAAWEVGRQLADNLLRRHLDEEGRFPESVGISLWSIDAFKSDGEVLCQILWLMGMRPIWRDNGRVAGVEPIPLDDLALTLDDGQTIARPRVDAVIQTSSLLRDMVPHFADLLDEAAVMAGDLDEPMERNCIRKHTLARMAELRRELGEARPDGELRRLASFRVFSSAPGAHGTGVGLALDASAWESDRDLAETYLNWSGYAYGSDRAGSFARVAGAEAFRLFAGTLATVDVTFMRQYAPEYDPMDCGCAAGALGGMSVAAKAVSGRRARIYWADNNAAGDHSVRDFKEELEAAVTAKLLNPHWLDDRKRQGYRGAGEVSSRVNTLFHWSATTGAVAGWVFDRVAATYVRDRDTLAWLRRENPYALEEISRRLLEAQSRGLWQADADLLAAVQDAALMVEGDMEERIGEVDGTYQGGGVEVRTAGDVEKWRPRWRLERTGG